MPEDGKVYVTVAERKPCLKGHPLALVFHGKGFQAYTANPSTFKNVETTKILLIVSAPSYKLLDEMMLFNLSFHICENKVGKNNFFVEDKSRA